MSGIAGVYYLDGRPVERTDLERMVSILAHRGPDGAGIWNEGSVGLGHRMLWTTPESLHERLPLEGRAGDLVITADARIDNREELISALGFETSASAGIADSQLILAAYEKWGEQCPEKLLGDFVFVIWDRRCQSLFCARDHFGIKPFYYYQSDRLFAFGSEIKSILCLSEVPRRLNETRVADYLAVSFDDKTITFYEDVFRLPAAHSVTVRGAEVQLRCYWTPDLSRKLQLGSDDEYAEAFRGIFAEAVRCRLRSAFPVGSMLSGGLDSSSIACMARRLLSGDGGRPLHTFSAVFPSLRDVDKRIDERPYIDAVLASGDFQSHYVYADHLSPLANYDRVLWHTDEAVPAPNLYMDWALFQATRDEGVRVLFSGFDGDSVVSHGYERLIELARTARWRTLAAEATALSKRLNGAVSPWRIIWHYGFRPLAPEPAVAIWRILRGRPTSSTPVDAWIHPAFARRVRLTARLKALRKNGSEPAHTAAQSHWLSLTSGLLAYAAELLDKAAAAFSLDLRCPFFDRRLVEFCLVTPLEQKFNQGWPRAILRHAMTGVLPDAIRYRHRKGNLSSNFRLGFLERDRAILEKAVFDQSRSIAEYVDLSALHTAYRRCIADPVRNERDALGVFLAVTLAIWLENVELHPQYSFGTDG